MRATLVNLSNYVYLYHTMQFKFISLIPSGSGSYQLLHIAKQWDLFWKKRWLCTEDLEGSKQTGAKTDLATGRESRQGEKEKERFRGVERNQPRTQGWTWGQTEVIRCAGTRQDTAEGMAARHQGAFHLLRSYVKDISSLCVREVCVQVSMQCISFVLCHVCVLTFVYLSLLVSFTVSPSSLPVCVCVHVCVSVWWVLDIWTPDAEHTDHVQLQHL